MYRWMQAHSKKMMAIFGVLLMIVFVLPTTGNLTGERDSVYGHIGEQKITRQQMAVAAQEWDFIVDRVAPRSRFLDLGQFSPWHLVLFSQETVDQINRNPELFLMLQHEARRMGVEVHSDRLEQLDGQLRTFLPPPATVQDAQFRRQALEHLLLVGGAFDRAGSALKISEPRVRQEIAEQYQSLRVKLVEFRAADFAKDVPAPTPEQVQAHIDKFGDVQESKIDPVANPFGFSYLLPDRVKLQYIQIPREPMRKVVEKSQSEFEWRSQAFAHYEKNKARYQTSEPATQEAESTAGKIGDLTMGGSTTKPAEKPLRQKPFDEVYGEIKSDLMRPKVDQKLKQVQDRVASLLTKGYERYDAQRAGKPVPEGSGIKADYISHEYLEQVANQIDKEFGVRPIVQSVSNQWLAESDLMGLRDIGSAFLPGRTFAEATPLAQYILSKAEPFRDEKQKQEPDTLSLWEPSAALASPSQDAFFFRLTDAQKAHKPAAPEERQEVVARAEQDLKTIAGYEKALAAAKALHEQVKSGGPLADAAKAAGRPLIEAGPIARMPRLYGQGSMVQGYSLGAASRNTFADAAYGLLREATPEQRHPKTLVELPREAKVVVAELDSIERRAGEALANDDPAEMTALAANVARFAGLVDLATQWFSPDNIRQRIAWKPA